MKYRLVNKKFIFIIRIFDFIGNLIFFIPKKLQRKENIDPQKIKKIVASLNAHIGDVVMLTPAIRAIKEFFPNAHLSIIVKTLTKDVIIGNPYVDEIITFDGITDFAVTQVRQGETFFNIKQTFALWKRLRKGKYDLSIDFKADIRIILLFWLARIKYRIGYTCTGGGFLLTHPLEWEFVVDAIELNLRLLRGIGIKDKNRKTEVFPQEEITSRIVEFLLGEGIFPGKDLVILLHPGTGRPNKMWDNGKFGLLGKRLIEIYNSKIIISGSPEEVELTKEIRDSMGYHNACVTTGKLTKIRELASLIQLSNIVICTDTGPMHMAIALDKPTISLFGPTNPSLWHPYENSKHLIVQKTPECGPCNYPDCLRTENRYQCMQNIDVEDVLEKIHELL